MLHETHLRPLLYSAFGVLFLQLLLWWRLCSTVQRWGSSPECREDRGWGVGRTCVPLEVLMRGEGAYKEQGFLTRSSSPAMLSSELVRALGCTHGNKPTCRLSSALTFSVNCLTFLKQVKMTDQEGVWCVQGSWANVGAKCLSLTAVLFWLPVQLSECMPPVVTSVLICILLLDKIFKKVAELWYYLSKVIKCTKYYWLTQ